MIYTIARAGLRALGKWTRKREAIDFPISNFSAKHIENCKSLVDRMQLLDLLPKNAIVAEIGVFKADFSKPILDRTKPSKFYLIDSWASKRYNDGHFDLVNSLFVEEIKNGQVELIRDLSFNGIQALADDHLDWVYLDTDHSLKTTQEELRLLLPKMKSKGIIAGHDYIQGNWNGVVRYGVIEAVREFCLRENWELIYLTHELDNHPSFAIRAIE